MSLAYLISSCYCSFTLLFGDILWNSVKIKRGLKCRLRMNKFENKSTLQPGLLKRNFEIKHAPLITIDVLLKKGKIVHFDATFQHTLF